VIVEDDQLSLAIGKKGQNVRLAAKLTKWRLDIKSRAEYEQGLRTTAEDALAGLTATPMAAEEMGEAMVDGTSPIDARLRVFPVERGMSSPTDVSDSSLNVSIDDDRYEREE